MAFTGYVASDLERIIDSALQEVVGGTKNQFAHVVQRLNDNTHYSKDTLFLKMIHVKI